MKKFSLPAPPSSSFAPTAESARATSTRASQAPTGIQRIAPLDLNFLTRVARTSVWFTLLLCVLIWFKSQDVKIVVSFAVGAALGIALLGSQVYFVKRLANSKAEKQSESSGKSKLMAGLLLPVKYLALLAFVGIVIRGELVQPIPFIVGVSVIQFVIVAKVLGQMMTRDQRSLREIYVQPTTQNEHSAKEVDVR